MRNSRRLLRERLFRERKLLRAVSTERKERRHTQAERKSFAEKSFQESNVVHESNERVVMRERGG